MWIYAPSPYAQEAADSSWESALPAESVASLLASSVTWRGKPSPRKSWLRAFKTASWTTRLYGRISRPLTLARCAEKWISSLPAGRVNLSLTRGAAMELLTPDTFGPTLPKWSPQFDLPFSSGKTSTATSLSDSLKSDKTWKKWVTGLRRSSLARRKLAQRICASGCSSWPTATAGDAVGSGSRNLPGSNAHMGTFLTDLAVRMWPSPQTPGGGRSVSEQVAASKGQTPDGRKVTVGLESAVRWWPTPTASDDNKSLEAHLAMKKRMGGNRTAVTSLSVMARGQFKLWTTPQSHDQSGGNPDRVRRYGAKHGAANLADDVTTFSLPPQTTSQPGPTSSPDEAILPLLCRIWADRALRKLLRLNPSFVEWLMNWPPGWASLEPIDRNAFNYWVTGSSQQVRRLLSAYSQEGLG